MADLGDLSGQVVVVTGAAQGIGESVAHLLRKRGADLVLADIQGEKVAEVAAGLNVLSCEVDIADATSARSMINFSLDQLGRVDALINVAGIDAPYVSPLDVDARHWDQLIAVDLSGAWYCISAVLPHMVSRGSGKIVNIASVCGVVPCKGVSVAYAAAKAGLVGMTMALAADVEQHGVLINAIAPGVVGTTGTPMSAEQAERFEATFPLGAGGPEPVADAVLHLLSTAGDWTSGAVMNVSGGFWRGR